ncbi:MAG: hypothetical protein M3Q31_21640 [Actinomycetota bacterium]|nr:hypothetical protein [Actinomycetota bacterium]
MEDRPRRSPSWLPRTPAGWALVALGLGAFVAGATTLLVLLAVLAFALAPLAVWFAWNVLDFAGAIGAPELGLGGILLLTIFLVSGLGARLVIAAIVALVDPSWLHGSARLHWPQPSLRAFVALALLLAVAAVPSRHRATTRSRSDRQVQS